MQKCSEAVYIDVLAMMQYDTAKAILLCVIDDYDLTLMV